MAGAIDLHTHIGGGKVNLARALVPELNRREILPATAVASACAGGACALHAGGGIPLRGDGLHRLLRAGHAAVERAPGPHGDGRYADRRQGCVRAARERRLPAAEPRGRGGSARDQRLRRLDPARRAGARHQGRQRRRHQRLQVQRAHARRRRAASALSRFPAPGDREPGARRARARRAASAARPCEQSRRAGQCRQYAGDDRRSGRLPDPSHPSAVPQLRERKASGSSRRRRCASPRR